MRAQASIWEDTNNGEADKLRQEATLLREQLAERTTEAAMLHTRITQAEATNEALKQARSLPYAVSFAWQRTCNLEDIVLEGCLLAG